MTRLTDRLRHAFATDPAGPATPTETQRMLVDKLCAEVVRRRLTTSALLMLEMTRPLNYVSSQLLHFFQPMVAIITDTAGYEEITRFLEQRGSIDFVCHRLEAIEAQMNDPHVQD
jgi:hypothetical protein